MQCVQRRIDGNGSKSYSGSIGIIIIGIKINTQIQYTMNQMGCRICTYYKLQYNTSIKPTFGYNYNMVVDSWNGAYDLQGLLQLWWSQRNSLKKIQKIVIGWLLVETSWANISYRRNIWWLPHLIIIVDK